jgi:hypothetical protein
MHPSKSYHFMRRRGPKIFDVNFNLDGCRSGHLPGEREFLGGVEKDICPQLPSAGRLSFSDQQLSGYPQQEGYKSNQPLSRLHVEDRDLRSVIASMLAVCAASLILQAGWTFSGILLAIYGIYRLLLRVDVWSLWGLL